MLDIGNNARFPRWIWIYISTAIVMMIAAGVFIWLASESRREAGAGRTANSKPVPAREIPVERIELLARFEAPAAEASAARSGALRTALMLYSNRDYARAIPKLRSAGETQPDSAERRFYLGICYLLTNHPTEGVKELQAVAAAGDSPYTERSRFYLAKGLLSQRDVRGAAEELRKVVEMHGALEREAGVLLAQIVPRP
jgi:TolA-binding protein